VSGQVDYEVRDGIAFVTFNRPEARNAMTWAMYDGLARACEAIVSDEAVRVALLRGAGGSFVAGTDIQQFTAFNDGEDGIAYEKRIEASVSQIEHVSKPMVAAIEGFATGGGLIIAASCDFRLATPDARFGVPIARTLGNCISVGNVARLMAHFGTARAKRMLLLAEMVDAEEARACGFVESIHHSAEIGLKAEAMCKRLSAHAPITMRASKEAMRRVTMANLPDGSDLIRACYASADFKEGMTAFLGKRKPEWTGR
jgi:enoyl-CoA hydratase/carnithine racemase